MLNHSLCMSDLSHSTLACSRSLHNCSHTTSILILSSPGRVYDFQAANGEEVKNLQHTHTHAAVTLAFSHKHGRYKACLSRSFNP